MIVDVSEAIRAVVAKVQIRLLAQLQAFDSAITQIHYEHGHPIEIDETMSQYDDVPAMRGEKYPCVMLIEDLEFDYGDPIVGINCRIVIAHQTQSDWKSGQRDQKTFIPVLRPIYEALKEEIINSSSFYVANNRIKHRVSERKFWGRPSPGGNQNTANKFTDYIDAIDMQNVRLSALEQPC